jgi:hypothetical protein
MPIQTGGVVRWPRRVAITVSIIGWMYSWFLFRRTRSEYLLTHASPPLWLLLLMGALSTLLIATAIVAGMRAGIWPALAVGAGVAFVAMVVLGQMSVMQNAVDFADPGATTVGLGDAFRASIRERSPLGAAVIAGVPITLLLSGLTGAITGRKRDIG